MTVDDRRGIQVEGERMLTSLFRWDTGTKGSLKETGEIQLDLRV